MSKKHTKKYLHKALRTSAEGTNENKVETAAKSAVGVQKSNFYNFIQKIIAQKYSLGMLLLGFIIVIGVVFKDYLFMYRALLFRGIGSDTITIFYPSYLNAYHAANSETAGLWSFWMGMGTAVSPGYSFLNFSAYFIRGINSLVTTDISKVPFAITYQLVAVIFMLCTATFVYLRLLNLNYFSAILGTLLFSFSGFVLVGSGWHHYPYSAFIFIFLLISFELLLQKRIWLLMPLAVILHGGFGMGLYFNVLFLFFYAIFRFIDLNGFQLKKLSILGGTMILLGVLGIGLTASGFIPTYLQTVEAPRFAGNSASLVQKLSQVPVFGFENDPVFNRGIDGNHYITALLRLFSPDIVGTGAEYVGWNNYLEGPNFYVGLISLLLLPLVFVKLQGFKRWLYAGFLLLWLLPIIFPYFRFAFHMFVGNYYKMTFNLYIPLVILFFSMSALNGILKKRKVNPFALGGTWLVLMIILFADFYPETIKAINTPIRNAAALLLTANALLLYSLQYRNISVYSKYLIYVLVVAELSYFGYISLNDRILPGTNQSAIVSRGELRLRNGYNDYTVEALDYIKKLDIGFYRTEKDYQSGDAIHGSLNDAMAQGYFGTASYSSMQDLDYVNFLAAMELINPNNEAETRWIRGLRSNPLLLHWASVKYFLSSPTQNDPAFPSSSYLQMGYDSLTQFYDVKVLKSRYALPLGFTYDKVIKESEFIALKKEVKESVLLKYLIINNNDSALFAGFGGVLTDDTVNAIRTYPELESVINARHNDSIAMKTFKQDHITYSINTNKEQILFFSIPHNIGWQAFANGKELPIVKSNIGFMSVILPLGNYEFEFKFTPYLMKESFAVQTGFELLYGGMIVFFFVSEFRKRKKKLQTPSKTPA